MELLEYAELNNPALVKLKNKVLGFRLWALGFRLYQSVI
jgi:hypothetical protein